MTHDILSTKDVAKMLHRSVSWVRQAAQKKLLPHYKPSPRTLYFKRDEIEGYVFGNRIPTKEEQLARLTAESYFPQKNIKDNKHEEY